MADNNGYPGNGGPESNDIMQRLGDTWPVAHAGVHEGAAARKKILRDRARQLARIPASIEPEGDILEVVEFVLAHEKYGFELTHIREIHPLRELTLIPCTPAFVKGIINYRGQILSIVDLKSFFNIPDKGLTNLNRVIVLRSDTMEFGVLADEILGVEHIPISRLQPPLPTMTGIQALYLKGITTERTVILDAEKLLSDHRIVVQQEVAT